MNLVIISSSKNNYKPLGFNDLDLHINVLDVGLSTSSDNAGN